MLGQRRDMMLRINHLDIVIQHDVGRRHGPWAFLADPERCLIAPVHTHRQGFEIKQYLNNIFLHAFDRRILVQHAIYFYLCDGGTRH